MGKNIWAIIKVLDIEHGPYQVYCEGKFNSLNSIIIKCCAIEISLPVKKNIPVEIIVFENVDSRKPLGEFVINIRKKDGLAATIDNFLALLSRRSSVSLSFEFIFRKQGNGFLFVISQSRYHSESIYCDCGIMNIQEESKTAIGIVDTKDPDGHLSAEECFRMNLFSFVNIIDKTYTSKDDKNIIILEWKNIINDLSANHSSILNDYFNVCGNELNIWKSILESWGIKVDRCKRYPMCTVNVDLYNIEKNGNDVLGPNDILFVKEPAISMIDISGDQNKEIILKKGVLWQG